MATCVCCVAAGMHVCVCVCESGCERESVCVVCCVPVVRVPRRRHRKKSQDKIRASFNASVTSRHAMSSWHAVVTKVGRNFGQGALDFAWGHAVLALSAAGDGNDEGARR